jgi:TPR repeat protein
MGTPASLLELIARGGSSQVLVDQAKTKAETEALRATAERIKAETREIDSRASTRDALKRQRISAEKGNAAAQFALGMQYSIGQGVPQDYVEAAKWIEKAALQGHLKAQYTIGVMYDAGKGVPQDYAEAVKWYRVAAGQGDADSQFNLGGMFTRGQGVPQDHAEAVKWFQKAAEQKHVIAQFIAGVMYATGKGVPQDYVEAHMWINLAASGAGGDYQKQFAEWREKVAKDMTPQQITEAQRRAREWKPSAGR